MDCHPSRLRINLHLTGFGERNSVRTLKFKSNPAWVCPRIHDEIIFQLATISVINHVDFWINIQDSNTAKNRDSYLPFTWILSYQIVHRPGQLIRAFESRSEVSIGEFHAKHRSLLRL